MEQFLTILPVEGEISRVEIDKENTLNQLQSIVDGFIQVLNNKRALCPDPMDESFWASVAEGSFEHPTATTEQKTAWLQAEAARCWFLVDQLENHNKVLIFNDEGRVLALQPNPHVPFLVGNVIIAPIEVLGVDDE